MKENGSILRACIRRQYHILTAACVISVFIAYLVFYNGYTKRLIGSRTAGSGNRGSPSARYGRLTSNGEPTLHSREMDEWPGYIVHLFDHEGFKRSCLPNSSEFSIAGLPNFVKSWAKSPDKNCTVLYDRFSAIYSVEKRFGNVRMPKSFEPKVRGWLGNKDELFQELFHQEIIHMINMYTRETTVFNPLRDKRPVTKPKESEEDYIKRITKESEATCDFCRYKNFTAEHTFGREETKLSFTASNIFKLDTLHAVVTIKDHDPINWSLEQYMDMMMLTVKWLKKAHASDPSAVYPAIIWDLLPKSGSSQLHPHDQVFLSPNRYQGMVETWRRAAQDYFVDFQSNYFSDLVSIYSALGLVATHRSAVALASLTPRKDNEVIIIAPEADTDFFELIYYVLRAYIDDMKKYSFSLGGGFPAMSAEAKAGRIPAFVRVITRGVTTEIRTDISALELFTATNVNIDPYRVIAAIQDSVKKRASVK
ncbi:hypothetical protein PoB_004214400 [Plakobranchus ocellatus]|uniref:Galactose-1-phosphate uridylyltransferase n=1 Tax=Plakobranchus ocellatus TaxID=259542 RepID=A0AAV4BA97_9GAST|nr:hypothetical protein PoB_004214400 [Plakobranchus ocellatus]